MNSPSIRTLPVLLLLASSLTWASGCVSPGYARLLEIQNSPIPRELEKITLPDYVVEPPDILLIQSTHTLRSPDSKLLPGDRLRVLLKNGLPVDVDIDPETNQLQYNAEAQIEIGFKVLSGSFRIGSDGMVDFGPAYGKVPVENLTIAEAEAAIRRHLVDKAGILQPELHVTLEDAESPQPIDGEHLVRPDGKVALGIYGDVYVAGMTLPEVREAVKGHLAENGIQEPKVAVDVASYNSKLYYVITDGGGFGEAVTRLQYTGNETVLDAISQIQGLPEVSSKRIWIARPGPAGCGTAQILEVEWEDIAALGQATTNYQILPGDRIYIQADKMIALDNYVEKLVGPLERVLGVSLLGFNVVRQSKAVYPITNQGGNGGGVF